MCDNFIFMSQSLTAVVLVVKTKSCLSHWHVKSQAVMHTSVISGEICLEEKLPNVQPTFDFGSLSDAVTKKNISSHIPS